MEIHKFAMVVLYKANRPLPTRHSLRQSLLRLRAIGACGDEGFLCSSGGRPGGGGRGAFGRTGVPESSVEGRVPVAGPKCLNLLGPFQCGEALNNKMLGWRQIVDGKVGPYLWKTYKEVYEEVLHIGSALRKCGAEPGARVGIYGINCPQWVIAMEACCAHSLICVPLYDTLGPGAVSFIVDHAEIDFAFVQDKKVKRGKENPADIVPPKPQDIGTIMYTSGTSGHPKGVVLTHENAILTMRGVDLFMEQFEDKVFTFGLRHSMITITFAILLVLNVLMTVDDVYLSFLPLAHILDRMIEEYFFHNGASVGYYHGDIEALREDLMELKPTLFAGVMKTLEELNPRRRKIFDMLFRHKLYWMNKGYKHRQASPLADLLAFRKVTGKNNVFSVVKAKLGGRVRLIISGGAALSTELEEFLRVTSCAFVIQGLTETCGLSTISFPDEMCMLGAVGVPSVYTELRLEEVPDMGYSPFGDPPRGEICVRGKPIFSGYYKNPELTKEAFKDGWFHTGDIGELLPSGAMKIIDRKKNIFKLSQGEYIAVEYLEKIYSFTPIVEDIWVYGDSFKSKLVAVVVPNERNTKKWAESNGYSGSFAELSKLPYLEDYILLELKSTAEKHKEDIDNLYQSMALPQK
ncbi:hypothetical protein Syun_008114 [Stephania yunnanensis]|uniref:AMP-dependent synthetase/ligase domain-containing protein n=1 Tax=Stephania yunnanensis TaxID=152371 RepID=A0AAP0KZS0_9MAGN